jgi:hypothetical protein
MTDTTQERNQESLIIFQQEIKKALNGIKSSPEFDVLMTIYFQHGFTAHQALSKFFENGNKELEKEILELTNQE